MTTFRATAFATAAALSLGFFSVRANALTLPPPPGDIVTITDAAGTSRDALIIDGVPVAFYYEDFVSYSAKMLDAVQAAGFIPVSYGDYQFATGTGGLDVILGTGANGATNQNVGAGGAFDFEDPTSFPTGNSGPNTVADVWWGQNDQNNDGTADAVNGPVTVGNVLDYLHSFSPATDIPVFYLDLNNTGNTPQLLFSMQVCIEDLTGAPVQCWHLDSTQNGTYDAADQALAFGEFNATGTSGTNYSVNHNLGSGSPDFIAFAPDMDLSQFDPNFRFVTEIHMAGLNNGYEEAFLTGAISTTPPPPVPAPGVLALMGAGLLGLRFSRRR